MEMTITTKRWLSSIFEMKEMGEANYVLGVKIFKDRSKKLLVGMVSHYQSNLGPDHWQAVKRIFRYFCGTSNLILCYQGGDLKLRGCSDADWASNRDGRKSIIGYAFLLSGATISWCSLKQSCIALSTIKSEYVACLATTKEAVWLKRFFQSLRVTSIADEAVKMYYDNMTALAYAKDPKYHSKSKHI
ncbi:secreted RxLR effector protein 161-like [Castanea sativa]|uniref:secreted RxLR effector protein 161-like n=1 Tax=Castanea sativa TaxID=21020 RepID=UPI003F64BD5A